MESASRRSNGLRHPLLNQLRASPNPEICARQLGKVLPLHNLVSLTPASEWWHQNGELSLNHLPIAASIGSPYEMECDSHPFHRLVLLHDGQAAVQQNDHRHELEAGDGVILPGQSWTFHGNTSSSTTIGFDPLILMSAARGMAPAKWLPPSPVSSPLHGLLPLPTQTDGHCAALVNAIGLELPAIHHIAQLGKEMLEGLLLHEQLYRMIAALIFPELRNGQPACEPELSISDRRLDRLLDYISLHLADPLPLSVLEAQSHYSRRSLHYAFQERFGFSPMQWIRQQRMQVALQRLQNPNPGDTVASVALSCGYRSQSRFRIDFERSYGVKPSAVLRGTAVPTASSSTNSLAP